MNTTRVRGWLRGASITAISAVALASMCGTALAATGGDSASGWHVGMLNPSGRTVSNGQAGSAPGAVATFGFPSDGFVNLLTTDQKAKNPMLLGDLNGRTVTAQFTVNNVDGNGFTYQGEGTSSNPCVYPANARLYFATSNSGGFDPTHYWWSNPANAVLSNGTMTVTATVEPNEWSDYYGAFGGTVPGAFTAAASNVTDIGLSFGGGCFFENGVGTDGSGTFTLDSFNAG